MTAIVVLGMHRSGTSCLAGMLAAGGLASAGAAVRNWDNARGHHEMLDVVRLDEAVLAHSGGHYLSPPPAIRWTAAHAARRDELLARIVDGRPALLKDPRMLLALPFWRASALPFRAIGIVRHPLAVARSLESWRGMPLADGIALYVAHNRALLADRAQHGYPVVDFELPKPAFVDAVVAACGPVAEDAYDAQLVHHDDADAPDVPGLDEAVALYRALGGLGATRAAFSRTPLAAVAHDIDTRDIDTRGTNTRGTAAATVATAAADRERAAFPRAPLAAVTRALDARDTAAALAAARAALAAIPDAAAVLVPIVAAFTRAGADPSALIDEAGVDAGLAALLHGKARLAAGDATAAVAHLAAACAAPDPLFQARHLLPQALRAAGQHAAARAALARVAGEALYPHGPLATLAEWTWLDGDRATARTQMRAAIEAAPPHRRGRLRTRLAEWLIADGDTAAARSELTCAIDEDPAYARSRDVLATI